MARENRPDEKNDHEGKSKKQTSPVYLRTVQHVNQRHSPLCARVLPAEYQRELENGGNVTLALLQPAPAVVVKNASLIRQPERSSTLFYALIQKKDDG